MSNETFEPRKVHVLTENDQIKAYVHPTRMYLLQLLAKEKRTISSVAKELGVHPANITHHFKLMEKIGLIRLVEKRDTGKNLEKYYRAVAHTFEVAPSDGSVKNKKALALSILRNDLSAVINTLKEGDGRKVTGILISARLSSDQVDKFIERLQNLLKEFEDYDSNEGILYTANMSVYPNELDHLIPQEVKL